MINATSTLRPVDARASAGPTVGEQQEDILTHLQADKRVYGDGPHDPISSMEALRRIDTGKSIQVRPPIGKVENWQFIKTDSPVDVVRINAIENLTKVDTRAALSPEESEAAASLSRYEVEGYVSGGPAIPGLYETRHVLGPIHRQAAITATRALDRLEDNQPVQIFHHGAHTTVASFEELRNYSAALRRGRDQEDVSLQTRVRATTTH